MNKELIRDIFQDIIATTDFEKLTKKEKVILVSNLLLLIIQDDIPEEFLKEKESFLNNGKQIAFQLNKYLNNIPLQIALKAHLIVGMAGDYYD